MPYLPECQYAELLLLMIPQAVEVLSLTALPKERIDSSGMVHSLILQSFDCREVSQHVT